MISIKKYLDLPAGQADAGRRDSAEPENPGPESLLVQAYRSTLVSVGSNGARACPAVAAELHRALAELLGLLGSNISATVVQKTEKSVSEQLDAWGSRAGDYFKSKTGEVKELLIALARTAESMGQRDLRYSEQFGQFTRQLESIANLEDLGQVRSALVRQAKELKVCVDQMAEENRRAITTLKGEVSVYETKLREAETIAFKDSLTGLLNRRSVEQRIEAAMASARPFCVVMLDLNGFKQVNDTHGHGAGDSLLTQFAKELRSNVRGSDIVGRWGGDEFVLLLECDADSAKAQIGRIEKWAFGEYTLPASAGGNPLKLPVRASVGVAEWRRGDKLAQLIERADQAMYREKKMARKQGA
jgi:diguanylate cyclase (GGDEF)-like protein